MSAFLMPSPVLALCLLCLLTGMAYLRPALLAISPMRHVLAGFTLWAWLCCTPAVSNAIMVQLEGSPLSAISMTPRFAPNAVVIVLGSAEMFSSTGLPAPRLDEHGWERLHAGVQLWRQTGGQLIFTGGPGADESTSIAGKMRGIAVELGVPSTSVRMATRSINTYQDMVMAQALLSAQAGPVWLVTSAVHMPRAMAVARKLGISAQPYPVDYRQIDELTWRAGLPDSGAWLRMTDVTHELLGRMYYRYKGWSD